MKKGLSSFLDRFLCAAMMVLFSVCAASAQGTAAGAEAAAPAAAAPGQVAAPGFAEVMIQMLPMFVAVFFVFHLLVTRPQQQKIKQQQDLLGSLKRGDSVVTNGGIFGRVSAVEKDHVLLEIAQNVRVKCEASAIAKREESKVETSKGGKA